MKTDIHKKKQTSFRLSNYTLSIIDKIKEVESFESRTVTLEFMLRDYLNRRGINLNDNK